MESDLSERDFAIRRLGTTCRLLKNWEDIAAKYANVKDDDIVDLTDLSIHRDNGRISRSDVKSFGFSGIRYTRKTLPDEEIHKTFGDCLEDEFLCNFGEADDGFDATSVAGISMVSTKTAIEVMEEKMAFLKLEREAAREETSDAETLSSSDTDEEEEFELTNPKSLLSRKSLISHKPSFKNGCLSARKMHGQSTRDVNLHTKRRSCTRSRVGVSKSGTNHTMRRAGTTRWKSFNRQEEVSDEWESESLSSNASGEVSKAEFDMMLQGTPSKKGRKKRELSKLSSVSKQMGSVHEYFGATGFVSSKQAACRREKVEFDSMKGLTASEVSDVTVDSGVVKDCIALPILKDEVDDVFIVESNDVSYSGSEDAVLLSCDEESVDVNCNTIKTPDKDLNTTYLVISPEHHQQAVCRSLRSTSKSSLQQCGGSNRCPESKKTFTSVGSDTVSNKPRRIQPTLLPETQLDHRLKSSFSSPVKIKQEHTSPLGSKSNNFAQDLTKSNDHAVFRVNGQPYKREVDFDGQISNQQLKDVRQSIGGSFIEIRPADDNMIEGFREEKSHEESVTIGCAVNGSEDMMRYDSRHSNGSRKAIQQQNCRVQDCYSSGSLVSSRKLNYEVQPMCYENDVRWQENMFRKSTDGKKGHLRCEPSRLRNSVGNLGERRVLEPRRRHQLVQKVSDCVDVQDSHREDINYRENMQLQNDRHCPQNYWNGRNQCGFKTPWACSQAGEKFKSSSVVSTRKFPPDQQFEIKQQIPSVQSQPSRLVKYGHCQSKLPVPVKPKGRGQRLSSGKESVQPTRNDYVRVGRQHEVADEDGRHIYNQLWHTEGASEVLKSSISVPTKRKRAMDSDSDESCSYSVDDNMSGYGDSHLQLYQDTHFIDTIEGVSPLNCTESQIKTVVAQNFHHTQHSFTREDLRFSDEESINTHNHDVAVAEPASRQSHRYSLPPTARRSPRMAWSNHRGQVGHQPSDQAWNCNSRAEHQDEQICERRMTLQGSTQHQDKNWNLIANNNPSRNAEVVGRNRGSDVPEESARSANIKCTNWNSSGNNYPSRHPSQPGRFSTARHENDKPQPLNSPRNSDQQGFLYDQGQLTPTNRRLRSRNMSKSPRLAENPSSSASRPRRQSGSPKTPTSGLRALTLKDSPSHQTHPSDQNNNTGVHLLEENSPRSRRNCSSKQESPRPKPVLKFLTRQYKGSPLCSPSSDRRSPKMQGFLDDNQCPKSAPLNFTGVTTSQSADKARSNTGQKGQMPRSMTHRQGRTASSKCLDFRGHTVSTPVKAVRHAPSLDIDLSTIRAATTIRGKSSSSTDQGSSTQASSPSIVRKDYHNTPSMFSKEKTTQDSNGQRSELVMNKVQAWLKGVDDHTLVSEADSSFSHTSRRESFAKDSANSSNFKDICDTHMDVFDLENSVSDDSDLVIVSS